MSSLTTGRFYTGATSNLEVRLVQHSSNQSRSTKYRGPWILIHKEEFNTMAEALRRERILKSGKGREELRRLFQEMSTPDSCEFAVATARRTRTPQSEP